MAIENKLKTILQLDDKDWKKALKSIAEAEKEYIKKSISDKEKLIDATEKLKNATDKASQKEAQELKKTAQIEKQQTAQRLQQINQAKKYYKSLEAGSDTQNKASKSTQSFTNNIVRHLRQIETLIVTYYALSHALKSTIGVGLEVNKMMEDNTNGIAALLSANTRMVLSNGEMVDSYDKFIIGQKVAAQTMEDLRKASVKTYATFPQLTEIFQQAIGQTLAMGDSFGTTIDEINLNTVKLSQRMSNIAGAIGMPMDRVREEIRSLLSGNASTDSLISTMIFGSPSEANKAIAMAKERGVKGVSNMLDNMLKPFDALEEVDTYTRSLLQLEDAWSQTMAQATEPVFEDLKDTFKELALILNENKDEIVSMFTAMYEGTKENAHYMETLLKLMVAWKAGGWIASGLGAIIALAKTLLEVQQQYNTLKKGELALTSVIKGLESGKGFVAIATTTAAVGGAIWAYNELTNALDEVGKAYENLDKKTNKPLKLDKQIANIEAQIVQLTTYMNDPKIWGTWEKAGVSEQQIKNLENLTNKYNELLSTQEKATKIKEAGDLLTKIGFDKKSLEEAIKYNEKNLDQIVQLEKKINKANKEIAKLQGVGRKVPLTIEEKKISEPMISSFREQILGLNKEIDDVLKRRFEGWVKDYSKLFEDFSKTNGQSVEEINKYYNYLFEELWSDSKTTIEQFEALDEAKEKAFKKVDNGDAEFEYEWLKSENEDILKQLDEIYEKRQRDIDWVQDQSDSYYNLLDAQIELIDSANNWGESLGGVAGKYANIGKAITKYSAIGLKETKQQTKLADKFNKDYEKYGKDEEKARILKDKYVEDSAKIEQQSLEARMGAYSQLAGVMGSVFEQGSEGAIAFTAIQSALGIASSWTAIANAWALPFPGNLGAVAMVASQVMPLIAQLGSSGGGSGGASGVSVPSVAQTKIEDTKAYYETIIGRFDRQIKLLESIDRNGTVGRLQVKNYGATFAREFDLASLEVRSSIEEKMKEISDKANVDINTFYNSLFPEHGIIDPIEFFSRTSAPKLFENFFGTTPDAKVLNDWWESVYGLTDQEFKKMQNDFQNSISDFAVNIIGSINDLKDASKDLKNTYDEITKSTKYASIELKDAFLKVDELKGDKTFSEYIDSQIKIMDTVKSILDEQKISLLLSQNPEDIKAQIELINELSNITGKTFENGAEEALNYINSIDLVSESYKKVGDDLVKQMEDIQQNIISLRKTFEDLKDSISKTIASLLGQISGAETQSQNIREFWKKQEETNLLLSKNEMLSSDEQERLKSLVGDINSISSTIQSAAIQDNTKITNELVGQLGIIGRTIDDRERNLSIENSIGDLKDTTIELLGKDSDVVKWLSDIYGAISGISFSDYQQRLDIQQTYSLIDGSHENGLKYVPYDGYIAELHRGERVLTASENRGTMLDRSENIITNSILSNINEKLDTMNKNVQKSYEILEDSQQGVRPLSVTQ